MTDSAERTRVAADHSTAFTALADLASARIGGRAVAASDEFFAPKSNLLKPEPPVLVAGKFTSRGKWMDGWETRRRRTPGHDWCVVKLGVRGRIRGVNVETTHFTGNYPSHCSIDALDTTAPMTPTLRSTIGAPWTTILPTVPLRGNGDNLFAMDEERPWTHVRLNIVPDGGVARLRVYGDAVVEWTKAARGGRLVDLAAIQHGGLVLGASDMHFGAKDNMIVPGRARDMGDGWETRRRRGPGHDWAIVKLGAAGHVVQVEIDTNHFKGNYPDSASLDGCYAPGATLEQLSSAAWIEILAQTQLRGHHRHLLSALAHAGRVSHVRLNIFPDGGISRLRVHGTLAAD
jgi:allantoicase